MNVFTRLIKRACLLPFTAAALLASPATAQDPATVMAQAWQMFKTTCQQALFDQGTFIAETPTPGPQGITTVATSPDRQIVEARRITPGGMVSLRVIGLPGLRINICTLEADPPTSATTDVADFENPAPWVSALENVVRPLVPAPLVGGQLPLGYVVYDGTGQSIAETDTTTYNYALMFNWQGEKVPAFLDIAPYSLEFTAVRMEAGS